MPTTFRKVYSQLVAVGIGGRRIENLKFCQLKSRVESLRDGVAKGYW